MALQLKLYNNLLLTETLKVPFYLIIKTTEITKERRTKGIANSFPFIWIAYHTLFSLQIQKCILNFLCRFVVIFFISEMKRTNWAKYYFSLKNIGILVTHCNYCVSLILKYMVTWKGRLEDKLMQVYNLRSCMKAEIKKKRPAIKAENELRTPGWFFSIVTVKILQSSTGHFNFA